MDKDTFRYLVGGYYGIRNMDEYDLKVYVLKDIENYIIDYVNQNPIINYNYLEEAMKIEEELSLLEKLNDSLLLFTKLELPMELKLLIKQRIKTIKEDNLKKNLLS